MGDQKNQRQSILETSISSIISGGISRVFVHPLDTIKTKLYVQKAGTMQLYENMQQAVRFTLSKEGISGLYKGFAVSIQGSIPGCTIYFTSYEIFKKLFENQLGIQGPANFFFSGLGAETISCII